MWGLALLALASPALGQPQLDEARADEPQADDAAPAPEAAPTHDLRETYQVEVGTRIRAVRDTKTEMLINVMRRGKPLRVENKTEGYLMKYVDEVQAIPADGGGVFRIARTYTYVKDHRTGVVDRARRTVDLVWGPGGLSYDDAQVAELDENARVLLDAERRRPQGILDHIIPRRRLKVGDRWRIPSDKAAQLFLMQPEDLVEGKSLCYGQLVLARPRRSGGLFMRTAFVFKLVLGSMHEFVFDEPAEIKLVNQVDEAAHGTSPELVAKGLGELKGTGHHPEHPDDVDVEFTIRVATEYRTKLD